LYNSVMMPTAASAAGILSGQDNSINTKNLQTEIGHALEEIFGRGANTIDVAPPIQHEIDLEDILTGEIGESRTEPSKFFLKEFLKRLWSQAHQRRN